MTRYVRSAVVWGILLFCTACAETVTVQVTGTGASADPIPQRATYAVLPTSEVAKDPAFPEYAQLVSTKMDALGYKKTGERSAQLGVFLAYASTEDAPTSVGMQPPPMSAGGGMSASGSGGGGYGMATGTPAGGTTRLQYTNQLVIVVLDLKKSAASGAKAELWRGETMNRSNSNDLKALAPVMVDVAFRHLGETTSGSMRHQFTEEEIGKLRQDR